MPGAGFAVTRDVGWARRFIKFTCREKRHANRRFRRAAKQDLDTNGEHAFYDLKMWTAYDMI